MMNLNRSKLIIVITLASIVALAAACLPIRPTADPEIIQTQLDAALAKYNQLILGMSHAEVTAILGSEGEDVGTSSEPPGAPIVPAGMLKKYQVNGFEIRTTFSQDRLLIKGLGWDEYIDAPKTDAMTTEEKYNHVNIGMTYAEVVETLGSPGLVFMVRDSAKPGMSITGSGLDVSVQTYTTDYRWETYSWWTAEESDKLLGGGMLITFVDGVVTMKSHEGVSITDD